MFVGNDTVRADVSETQTPRYAAMSGPHEAVEECLEASGTAHKSQQAGQRSKWWKKTGVCGRTIR